MKKIIILLILTIPCILLAGKDVKMDYYDNWYMTAGLGKDWILAGYYEPYKFGVNSNFRLRFYWFYGEENDCNIYLFLNEKDTHPDADPTDFSKAKYGPIAGRTGSQQNIYYFNWYIKKSEIDAQVNKRFWVLFYFPNKANNLQSDDTNIPKNSMNWDPTRKIWTPDLWKNGPLPCWCVEILVDTPPTSLESTSFGIVKALFR